MVYLQSMKYIVYHHAILQGISLNLPLYVKVTIIMTLLILLTSDKNNKTEHIVLSLETGEDILQTNFISLLIDY